MEPRIASTGALRRFEEMDADPDSGLAEETPLERLRFFCSLALSAQDWIDIEQLFDAVEIAMAAK